jgi:vacuolar-type H+-ATPase subunit I/STV1
MRNVSIALRKEIAKNESWERKKMKQDEANRYESDKKKAAALHDELRMAILDHQISGVKKEPTKILRLRSKLDLMEAQQESLKRSLTHLVEMEKMTEDLSDAAQRGDLNAVSFLINRGAFGKLFRLNYINSSVASRLSET